MKGFIALISVLIMSALVSLITLGVSLRSLTETQGSSYGELSDKALELAQACAERATSLLLNNLSYAGSEHVIIDGNYSCDILAIEGVGATNRTIKAESTVQGFKRKIKVVINALRPTLQVTSWNEVADF